MTMLQKAFTLLKPVQNIFQKYMTFYDRMTDEKFLEEFFAMETWLNDNIPLAGETYRDFIKFAYQRNMLAEGAFGSAESTRASCWLWPALLFSLPTAASGRRRTGCIRT